MCQDNKYVPKKCPRETTSHIGEWTQQMFDPISNECVKKRKLNIPGKCNSYRGCLIDYDTSHIEKWVESNCAPSFHFEELTQKCIKSSLSNCSKYLSICYQFKLKALI